MKITFLVYNIYGMGGTVRTVANIANFFASKDYLVEIISIRRTSENPLFILDPKIKLTPLIDARRGMLFRANTPGYKKFLINLLLKIPSILIDKNEDLYKMFNLFIDLKLRSVIKRINKGVLITTIPSFNILSVKYSNKAVIKIGQEHKFFEAHPEGLQKKIKKYYGKLDGLTCLTSSDKANYEDVLKEGQVKIYKIENATHIPEETAKLDKKVIIAAGRFSYEKGYDLLILAFSEVIKKHPDWKLKIFGTGGEEESLRNLIFEQKAYNNIYLMPKTDKIIKEMINSSVYALSSRSESFGMVLIEAMSVGVPCVSFACTGPREVILDHVDGLLVEEGNIEDFTNSLLTLIESESLRKEMGTKAKENVERYTFNIVGGKWEELIQEQVKQKQKS
ncbi:glycosyltransferase family 4 protein [Neobacillus soli]|uniref:glycosyltransferase family 4 protein n=1 Tax=Neobacillus soli TaxID=220688 RepID=UPI0008257BC6|nr:glycosyltransferase family 4 protein [Neobacillus soli]